MAAEGRRIILSRYKILGKLTNMLGSPKHMYIWEHLLDSVIIEEAMN